MPSTLKEEKEHLRNWQKIKRYYDKIMKVEEGSCLIGIWQLLEEAENKVGYYKRRITQLRKGE